MSFVKKEAIENNRHQITFTIDKESFEAANNTAYKKNVAKMNIPGFRKGKAPRSVVEKMYGKGAFYEEAINECLPTAFDEALKASELAMVGQPEFNVETIDETGVTMTAKISVKPEIELNDYIGIPVTKTVKTVTDEEVDAELEKVLARHARSIEVTDRAAENGDTVTIDFDGSVDGVPFDGGKADGHELKLGSGAFIPGYEEQIVGKNIGETFEVSVSFPAEYHATELAGKPAIFKTTLHAIKAEELPTLDDDFAKDVSEFNTLDEYKADMKAKMQDRANKEADTAVEESIITALVEKVVADIPEVMFVQETENYVRDYDNRLRSQGLDLNTYFKYTGQSLETLREQMRPQAEKQVKLRLALEKIADLEKVTVADEKVEEEYQNIAQTYQVDLAQVKAMIDAKDIAADMRVKAAIDFVKEKAVVTEA